MLNDASTGTVEALKWVCLVSFGVVDEISDSHIWSTMIGFWKIGGDG